MKKLFITISIINLCGIWPSATAQQGVRLILRLDRTSLLESQPVWANVILINYTTTTLAIDPYVLSDDMTRGIRFTLIDESGGTVPKSGAEGIYDDFGMAKPRLVAPGDSITRMFDILGWFSTSVIKNAPPYLATMHYLRAGSYTLRALQFAGKDTLRTNQMSFAVQRPSGKELQALNALKQADRKYIKRMREDATATAYEQILESFPHTVYGPYTYSRLIFFYHYLGPKENRGKFFDLIMKLGKTYPNDAQSLYVVSSYAPIILREGRQAILETLSRDMAQTKVGQISQRKLDEFRKQQHKR